MMRKYCVFGDSVTLATHVNNNWVNQLRQHLEAKYQDDIVRIYNLGIGGNTTQDILARFETEAHAREATHLIFAVGSNDSGYYHTLDNPIVPPDVFVANLDKLIIKAKTICQSVAFVGPVIGDDTITKPFPRSTTGKSYDRNRISDYNNLLQTTVTKHDCIFISILDKLDFNDFQDGLHPNDSGHRKMFEEIQNYF